MTAAVTEAQEGKCWSLYTKTHIPGGRGLERGRPGHSGCPRPAWTCVPESVALHVQSYACFVHNRSYAKPLARTQVRRDQKELGPTESDAGRS